MYSNQRHAHRETIGLRNLRFSFITGTIYRTMNHLIAFMAANQNLSPCIATHRKYYWGLVIKGGGGKRGNFRFCTN